MTDDDIDNVLCALEDMIAWTANYNPDPAFAEVREKAARALSEAVRKFDAE